MDRLFDSIEIELKQMRDSVDLYKRSPGRYRPQLEIVAHAARAVRTAANVILRTVGSDPSE